MDESPVYEILDVKGYHLGNVLMVFNDIKIPMDDSETGTVEDYRVGVVSSADYSPFGVQLDGRTVAGDRYRYGFNGMEKDDEVKGEGNSYTTLFRLNDPRIGRWLTVDPKTGSMPYQSPYCSMDNNPIIYNDIFGDSVWVFTTTLPGASDNMIINTATHSFIVVKTTDGTLHYFAYGPADHSKPLEGSQLKKVSYPQDKKVYSGTDTKHLKAKLLVPVPDDMTQEEFDQAVIDAAKSFGNNPEIEYDALTQEQWTGNCHTSSTTILSKAGVSEEEIGNIEEKIPGFNWGFEDVKPWTAEEQAKAVATKKAEKAKAEKAAEKELDKLKTYPTGPNKW